MKLEEKINAELRDHHEGNATIIFDELKALFLDFKVQKEKVYLRIKDEIDEKKKDNQSN